MKKPLLLVIVFLSSVLGASAQYYYRHQHNDQSALKLGVGLSSGFSVGPVSGYFPEAGALSVKLEVPLKKSPVSVLFSTGYTFFVSNSGYSVGVDPYGFGYDTYYYGDVASFIPLETGLKIRVARRVFLEGDAGVSFNVNSYSSDYTYKPTAFVFSPAIGYSAPLGFSDRQHIDLSLFYENRPETGGGYSYIGVRGVWNFDL